MVHLDKPLSLNPFGTGKVFKLIAAQLSLT